MHLDLIVMVRLSLIAKVIVMFVMCLIIELTKVSLAIVVITAIILAVIVVSSLRCFMQIDKLFWLLDAYACY